MFELPRNHVGLIRWSGEAKVSRVCVCVCHQQYDNKMIKLYYELTLNKLGTATLFDSTLKTRVPFQ